MYKVLESLGHARQQRFRNLYETARRRLLENVLPRNLSAEPHLTDHTATHVADVMANADRLIGQRAFESSNSILSPIDAYVLCLAILFHDAGMAFGRDEHQHRITEVYDAILAGDDRPIHERGALHWIAGAHTGVTANGSRDTIAEVPSTLFFDGETVQAQELAAILRFADELSEGFWRTSRFATERLGVVEPGGQVYHDYARITSMYVGRSEKRIVASYEIRLDDDRMAPRSSALRDLLEHVGKRVVKLDRERRYARSYSTQLAVFNRAEMTMNIWPTRGAVVSVGPIELSDKTVLDRPETKLKDIDPRYDVPALIRRLENHGTEMATSE